MKHSLSLRQRLEAYSSPADQNGCVNFTGSKTKAGYGLIHNPSTGKMEYAHRISYQLEHGPMPKTFKGKPSYVLHKCDNPSCVAPAHIVLGNQQLNMQDRSAKGRQNPQKKTRGKALTAIERDSIHEDFRAGLSGYAIASKYGKSQSHVSTLRRKWDEQVKKDGTTELLKVINKRLSGLLAKYPKKPCGSAPAPQTGRKVRGA